MRGPDYHSGESTHRFLLAAEPSVYGGLWCKSNGKEDKMQNKGKDKGKNGDKSRDRRRTGQRLAGLLGGSFLLGAGVGICHAAGWGTDPLSVFADGLAKTAALSFSVSSYLIYVLLAGVGWSLDRRQVTLWSFVSPFATSLGIEAVLRLLRPMQLSALSLICYLAGIAVMALGIAFTIRADMGKSPYDAFIFAVMARTGKGYAVIRWGTDVLWLAAGAWLGGVWGVGTVLALALNGKLTEVFGRTLDRILCISYN